VEPRPKIMMTIIIIMGRECKWGILGAVNGRRKGTKERTLMR
jgi:hypothetical protein